MMIQDLVELVNINKKVQSLDNHRWDIGKIHEYRKKEAQTKDPKQGFPLSSSSSETYKTSIQVPFLDIRLFPGNQPVTGTYTNDEKRNHKTWLVNRLVNDMWKPCKFGHGGQTLLDLNVRKCHEIKLKTQKKMDEEEKEEEDDDNDKNTTKFLMIAPRSGFCEQVEQTLSDLVLSQKMLSYSPEMRKLWIEPSKICIYKPGDHFVKHTDTVRDLSHVGTLVILLDHSFTGGELLIGPPTTTENTASSSVMTPHLFDDKNNAVFFFTDCPHQINPVLDGERVTLQCDVFLKSIHYQSLFGFPIREGEERNEENEGDDDDVDEEEDSDDEQEISSLFVSRSVFPTVETFNTELMQKYSKKQKTMMPLKDIRKTIPKSLFDKYTAIAIPLYHLYPRKLEDLNCLKGLDAELYESYRDDNKYKMDLCQFTIHSIPQCDYDYDAKRNFYVCPFPTNRYFPRILFHSLTNTATEITTTNTDKVLFITDDRIRHEWKESFHIFHIPGSEHTGNEAQAEKYVSFSTALIIREK